MKEGIFIFGVRSRMGPSLMSVSASLSLSLCHLVCGSDTRRLKLKWLLALGTTAWLMSQSELTVVHDCGRQH